MNKLPAEAARRVPINVAIVGAQKAGTPSYMFWPHAMERMRAYRADVRLIASLRDPIERTFSHWAMYFGKLASFPSFSELAQGPSREALLDRIPEGWNHLRMRRCTPTTSTS
jgi:hypothetical protein